MQFGRCALKNLGVRTDAMTRWFPGSEQVLTGRPRMSIFPRNLLFLALAVFGLMQVGQARADTTFVCTDTGRPQSVDWFPNALTVTTRAKYGTALVEAKFPDGRPDERIEAEVSVLNHRRVEVVWRSSVDESRRIAPGYQRLQFVPFRFVYLKKAAKFVVTGRFATSSFIRSETFKCQLH